MDKERLDRELEIDSILSEFSHKETAKTPRKVSDNTINMLLEDILGQSGTGKKSDGQRADKPAVQTAGQTAGTAAGQAAERTIGRASGTAAGQAAERTVGQAPQRSIGRTAEAAAGRKAESASESPAVRASESPAGGDTAARQPRLTDNRNGRKVPARDDLKLTGFTVKGGENSERPDRDIDRKQAFSVKDGHSLVSSASMGASVQSGSTVSSAQPEKKSAPRKTVGIKLTEIAAAERAALGQDASDNVPAGSTVIFSADGVKNGASQAAAGAAKRTDAVAKKADRAKQKTASGRSRRTLDDDPLESGRTDMETIPTWEERHSPEYLRKNPADPINKIRQMSGMKASSEFLEELKEQGGLEREKREVIYRKRDKFFSKKISFDTKKSRTVFEGLEKIGENEWKAAEEQETPKNEGSYEQDGEYHRFSESADVRRDLEYQKKSSKAETALTAVAAIMLIFLAFSQSAGSSLKIFYDNPKAFAVTNTVILGVAVLANLRTVLGGIAAVFRGRIIPGTVAAAAVVPSLIYNILLIFKFDQLGDGIYDRMFSGAAALCLLFVILGRNASLDLRIKNFELVGNREEKYPLMSFFKTKEAEELGRGLSVGDSKICLAGKCDDAADFMYHSYAEDPCIKSGKLLFFGSLAFSLVCAALCYFYPVGGGKGDVLSCYGVFCAVLCLTQPSLLSLAGNALFRRSAEKLKRDRIMLSGYDAVEEFSDTDILAVDAAELFPEGSVVLKGLKASENRMLDYSIIDAAKILEMAGGPLSPLFSKIMQNDTGFDPRVDTIIYEEEMGISGWVSGQRVLVGNRKLMELHGVRAPDYGYEQQYEGTGIRPVYLANEGRLTAIFLVQYKASRKIAEGLREAVKRGMSIAVYSCDSNITAPLLCRLFRLPSGSVRIMGSAARGIYKKATQKSKNPLDGALLCDGEARSMLRSVAVCKRMKKTLNFARALLVIMCLLGAVLAVGIVSSAGAAGLSVKLVCAFLALSFVVVRVLPSPGA